MSHDEVLQKFSNLLDQAIFIARVDLVRALEGNSIRGLEASQLIVRNLLGIKTALIWGYLLPSTGAILGLTQGIGEYSDNIELMRVASEIDRLYAEEMNFVLEEL
jgi:hypothetical protein